MCCKRLPYFAVLVIGAIAGYWAATGDFQLSRRVDAAPAEERSPISRVAELFQTATEHSTACCPEGLEKGILLSQGNAKASVQRESAGRPTRGNTTSLFAPQSSSRETSGSAAASQTATAASGEYLPFPPTPSASTAGLTMQDSVYKQRANPKRWPADAPNILIILIDDAGPGLPSTFGGEVHTPTLDRVHKAGISYNRFHSTAMCSPTRASLLTGRNHTRVGSGQIAELANDWDGFSGIIPKSSATIAEVLTDYGYQTGAWGKWHNTCPRPRNRRPISCWPATSA